MLKFNDLTGLRTRIHAGDYAGTAAEIVKTLVRHGFGRSQQRYPSFFVTGWSRSGKSLVSRKLQEDGFDVVPLDFLRAPYHTGSRIFEPTQKKAYGVASDTFAFRRILFEEMLKTFPQGLVLEGSDLWFHIRSQPDAAVEWLNQEKIPVFFLGCLRPGFDEKVLQLYLSARDGYCRMDRSRAWCEAHAAELIRESERMCSISTSLRSGSFIGLNSRNIDRDAEQAREAIYAELEREKNELLNVRER